MSTVSTTPLSFTPDKSKSIYWLLTQRVERTPQDRLVEYRDKDGKWTGMSATEFLNLVRSLAKGLIAEGIKKGESVSILSNTRWEWTALDCAIMSIGAVTVPIYQTNSASQVKKILLDSDVVAIFVEDEQQKGKVAEVSSATPELRDMWVIDEGVVDKLVRKGLTVSDEELDRRIADVSGDDLATIVYTSGSTGEGKGVEITHFNFVFIIVSGEHTMNKIGMREGGGTYLCFLPLAHVFARYMQFYAMAGTLTLALSSSMKTILDDFQATKPTLVLGVPRVFEKIYNAATQKAGTGMTGRIFARAAKVARQWSVAQQAGGEIPARIRIAHAFYDGLVYKQIRDVLGGHVDYIVSGGAPIDDKLAHFFNGCGLPLLAGYGMTETCAPAAVNPVSGYKIGSVGTPLEGMSFTIADDGEVLIKGDAVMRGYHKKPEETAEAIDKDGWLHSGDLGRIDEDGFIYLTGRKKDILITAGGKNVSPAKLEASVMTDPIISQCLVIGDRKPFIAALITLDLDATNSWLAAHGYSKAKDRNEARHMPSVVAEVDRAVKTANQLVSRAESIRKFEILDIDFTQDNGMLTPSLKAKRPVITKKFADLIDDKIYAPRK